MGLIPEGGGGGGAAGPAGPAGPAGAPGAPGERGATVTFYDGIAGNGPNPNQVPGSQPGDIAVNRTDWGVWVHTSERAWRDEGTLKGADGAAGAPGEKWFAYSLSSGGSPSPTDTPLISPKVGDLALNAHDGKVWRYTDAGWVERMTLIGPAGPAGAAGKDGVSGAANVSFSIFTARSQTNQNGQFFPLTKNCGPMTQFNSNKLVILDPTKRYLFELSVVGAVTGNISLQILSRDGTDRNFHGTHGTINQNEDYACGELNANSLDPRRTWGVGVKNTNGAAVTLDSYGIVLKIYVFDDAAAPASYSETRAEWESGTLDATAQTSAMRTDITLPVPPGTGGNTAAFARTSSGHIQVKSAGKVEVDAGFYIKFTETTRGAMEGYCRVSMGIKRRRGGDTETFPYRSTITVRTPATYYQNEAFIHFRDTIDCAANDEIILYLNFDDGGNIPSLGPNDQSRAAKWQYEGAGRNRVAVREVPA